MQEQNLNEVWQVDVNGTVYEAPFIELGEWIDGGSLLPDDKVRKGNLRWIEARKVPALVPFFNAKAAGEPIPLMITKSAGEAPSAESGPGHIETSVPVNVPAEFGSVESQPQTASVPEAPDPSVCALHSDFASFYLCDGCGSGLCKACPSSYGGSVRLCPLCGAMCRPAGEVREDRKSADIHQRAMSEGFGIADFFAALGHPFKFKPSLIFGALMFMFFTIGKGAGGLGGIFMFIAAIFSAMAANALTFGVLSHTVNNFIQGKLEENFMPEFEDFSIWDDVIHPFFLSIAAYISSFGPFIVVMLIGFYLIASTVSGKMDAYKSDLEKIPGTNVYAGRELADQSGDVKDVLKGIDQKQRERLGGLASTADGADDQASMPPDTAPALDEESRKQEELWARATENQKKSLESALGKTPDTEAREQAEMFQAFLGLAAPIVVIGGITFLWGLIFFPAACAVAGYSRTFTATINPLVGLDTIRRLGVNYVKILAMGLALGIISLFVSGILAAFFAVFNLPMVGNIPATAVGALFTFYFSVVFSCILGYALYKSSDKLGLSR